MGFLKIKNRAISSLASDVTDVATSWTLATGEGAKFPAIGNFHVTCEDEIVKCTSRSTDVLTIVRAQEGTSAVAHTSGKAVQLRITAGLLTEMRSKIEDADADTYFWVEKTADEDKIHGVVKDVEAFLLDDAGILTLAKQSSAKAYRNGAQNIPNATWTTVEHNAKVWDIQGEVNLTTHRFTCTVPGPYLMVAANTILDCPADAYIITRVLVNGADIGSGRFMASIATSIMANTTVPMYLNVDDYVESQVWQLTGATRNLEGTARGDYLAVHKLA